MPSLVPALPRAHDATDPLSSFHPAVADWFRSALGAPTLAQALSWPAILRGETTLLLAPTGSGKTLAAFLAAIERLSKLPLLPGRGPTPKAELRVLYISPLKALAVDVERNLRAPLVGIAEASMRLETPLRRLTVGVRTGDTPTADRAKMLRSPPDILVTTPESLYLLLTSQQRSLLAHVDTVIIDEIHQLVPTKRGAHLFLSLERLGELNRTRRIQRIGLSATQKPLDEIARLLGGVDQDARRPKPRPVTIVDASSKKALSITVEVPLPRPTPLLAEHEESEDSKGVWPQVHARLVERIQAARSTMVFVNSRRLAERLASALNEVAGQEIALAHHGSVAKDTRKALEERLKAGQLPAIVATSSLELGIDMGAVDQVIQVEAPPSVASGIQRIGRASHHVGGVPSGVLIPKHKQDLLACAAAAAGIEAGDVEATYYPRNALDVLAQQIVAVVATGLGPPSRKTHKRTGAQAKVAEVPEVDVEALFRLVRQAAPYATLPRKSFEGVLDMLSGRYPSDEFADLRPRLTWDRIRGVLTARAGTARLALLNGGTIPDRGLYGVFLKADSSTEGEIARGSSKERPSRRVGELDEEMVFELRQGEVFLLGASSWRADEITRDRVLVTPAPGLPGKMPFWHGDRAGRTLAFGQRVGALVRTVAALKPRQAHALLRAEHRLDEQAASDLVAYIHEEARVTGTVPTDQVIVVERVPDELGDLRICVLSPFGSRVHAPWSMVVLRRLREARAGEFEAVWSDDGMVFRVPGADGPPGLDLFFPSPEEIEDLVTRELGDTSLFAARFRESAARALLLPRRHLGRRTPLWAQRKKSSDLLAVAGQHPSFPIVLETYRECLRDAFDMAGLVEILEGVQSRRIRVAEVDQASPSPFAASLLFSFVGNFMYDGDAPAAERRAQALTIDQAQLRELLGETELRKLLDPDVVAQFERELARLDWPLRHADSLHDLLLWFGDLTPEEIAIRSQGDSAPWVAELLRARRAVWAPMAGEKRLVAIEDAARYRDALGVVLDRGLPAVFLTPVTNALDGLLARYARTHGPFTAATAASRFGIAEISARDGIERLVAKGKVTEGAFLPVSKGRSPSPAPAEYCDVEVLRALKRKTIARLRKAVEPVDSPAYARFLSEWQGIAAREKRVLSGQQARDRLRQAIGQLEGCPLAASDLESEILPARVPGYARHHLDHLLASGEVVWAGIEPVGQTDGRIALYLSDREPLIARDCAAGEARPSGTLHETLRELFARRGAIFFSEVVRTLEVFPDDAAGALWDLVWSGELTNDTFEPVRSLFSKATQRGRPAARPARLGPRSTEGRWSLRRSRWDREPTSTERATAIAVGLLERYGVVLREAPTAEGLPGGFSSVYDVYRAMEEQGRVRRGYFVGGRGATQFALAGSEEHLRRSPTSPSGDSDPLVLAATDPANPYGALLPWPSTTERSPQRTSGALVVIHEGRLLGWLSRGLQHLVSFLPEEEPERTHAAETLAKALVFVGRQKLRSIVLSTIDGVPSPESSLASTLTRHGFASRQGSLVRILDRSSGIPTPADESESALA